MVLLSNRDEALPLVGGMRRLALIGPLADAPGEMRGPWWCAAQPEEQIERACRHARGAAAARHILHANGVDIAGDDESGIAAALELCDGAEAVVLCLGEAATMSGEAASRAHPGLPGRQRQLAEAVLQRAAAAGGPGHCRPLLRAGRSSFPGSRSGRARCSSPGFRAARPATRSRTS